MKLHLAVLGSVVALCSIPAHAQYFSKGWNPGEPVKSATDATTAAATSTGWSPGQGQGKQHGNAQQATPAEGSETPAEAAPSVESFFDVNRLLVAGLNKFGFNVTLPDLEKGPWDERIPLITDDNYQDVIVNEEFASEEEAKKRTWALVITTSASNKGDAVSKFVDQMFDSAYNTSQIDGDLPHVRWGRIDYFKVTYITTKWNVWQAPFLVILKDRGQTLRFYRPSAIRVKDDAFLEFLRTEDYENTPVWKGLWAPGGEREWILEYFAVYMTKAYNLFVKIPKVLLYVISGGLGSLILSFMHRPSAEQKQKTIREAQEAARKAAAAQKPLEPIPESPTKQSSTSSSSTGSASKASKKSLGKARATTESVVSESSPERSGSSPTKTRASTRQRKGKKATQ